MHKVTQEQMNRILHEMGKPVPVNEGEALSEKFDPFKELNPYDYDANGGELEFNVAVYERDIASALEEAQEYPSDSYYLTEKQIEAVEAGAILTEKEKAEIRERFIEQSREEEDAQYLVVSEVSDGTRSIYILYTEMMCGQGGIQMTDFFGYFDTDEAARTAMNNLKGIVNA